MDCDAGCGGGGGPGDAYGEWAAVPGGSGVVEYQLGRRACGHTAKCAASGSGERLRCVRSSELVKAFGWGESSPGVFVRGVYGLRFRRSPVAEEDGQDDYHGYRKK